MTTNRFSATFAKNEYRLYIGNVFIGAWATEYELQEFCGDRGIEVVVA